MSNLYYCPLDSTFFRFEYTEGNIDSLVHASFTQTLPCVDLEVQQQSTRYLQLRSSFGQRGDIESLFISGPPMFGHSGYCGYTASEPFVRENYAFYLNVRQTDLLMGNAFVGSGSNVYTPILFVSTGEEISNRETLPHDVLPKILMYAKGRLVESQYNIVKGEFEAVRNPLTFSCADVSLRGGVQCHKDYIQNRELMEVPFKFKNEGSYPDGETFIPNSIVNWVKHIGRSIGFAGWNLGSFYDQLFIHFSVRGQVMRLLADGDRFHPFISKEQIQGFSGVGYDDLAQVVPLLHRRNSWIRPYHRERLLNRYLLYKSFIHHNEGSLLVGQIEGDSFTMHLPFAKVGLR